NIKLNYITKDFSGMYLISFTYSPFFTLIEVLLLSTVTSNVFRTLLSRSKPLFLSIPYSVSSLVINKVNVTPLSLGSFLLVYGRCDTNLKRLCVLVKNSSALKLVSVKTHAFAIGIVNSFFL